MGGGAENSIAELKEQINLLMQQNLKMYNELAKQYVALGQALNFANNRIDAIYRGNISYYLTQAASFQTAEFVIKNMNTVKYFDFKTADYYKYILNEAKNDGLFLEFGVFQGNTINAIATLKPDKIIYGFDSFEGLPDNWRSGFDKGTFDIKGKLPPVQKNVVLIKGWFNETLPNFSKENPKNCAFIHIDCDLYSSAKTIFSVLKNQIVSGTVIAFDEYFNYPGWQEGEYKALNEFIEETDLKFDYVAYTGHEQVTIKIK